MGRFRNQLSIYRKLKELVKDAKDKAERKIAEDPKYKHLDILGLGSEKTKRLMSQNKIHDAAEQSRKNYKKRQFLKHGVQN